MKNYYTRLRASALKSPYALAKPLLMAVLVGVSLISARPAAEMVFATYRTVEANSQKRKLPIYSVDVDEKKLAISFDAAWGKVN